MADKRSKEVTEITLLKI
jgi:hypothetical protein